MGVSTEEGCELRKLLWRFTRQFYFISCSGQLLWAAFGKLELGRRGAQQTGCLGTNLQARSQRQGASCWQTGRKPTFPGASQLVNAREGQTRFQLLGQVPCLGRLEGGHMKGCGETDPQGSPGSGVQMALYGGHEADPWLVAEWSHLQALLVCRAFLQHHTSAQE